MSLPEILTILLGILLSLIIFDGFRRALRSRKAGLKVDLMSPESIEEVLQDNEEYSDHKNRFEENEIFDKKYKEEVHLEEKEEEEEEEIKIEEKKHNLIIINLSSQNDVFSQESILSNYKSLNIRIEEQGYMSILDSDNKLIFTLLNAKRPGYFMEGNSSSDVALVLNTDKINNSVEAFDYMYSFANNISELFGCNVLDENRNFLTKQMHDHLRTSIIELKRKQLAKSA
mgnify:FL=1|tara:strand:- start:3296 stop:3982 length:687 start_codon:yes stop_codon:yes gene_type:complete